MAEEKGEQEGYCQSRSCDDEAEVRVTGFEDGGRSREPRNVGTSGSCKGQEMDSALEPSEGTSPAPALILVQ